MIDHIKTKLEKIPDVRGDSIMKLENIIGDDGTKEIANAGSIVFHATGDTGHENGEDQEFVANAMSADFDIDNSSKSPAFFLHLGDVDYYDNTDRGYHAQFYVPYKKYPGKFIAIPGNHDGELFKFNGSSTGQATTLEAFKKNFCRDTPGVPTAAGSIFREMVNQPGVYWLLDAPFVNIIGLYSNVAENPGFIQSESIGKKQVIWLAKILKNIQKAREKNIHKALIIAVHHPPLSQGSHSSSVDMLSDIDKACNDSGIMPDAVLAAHSHNYQRYTRYLNFKGKNMEIPFLVVGTGGRGIQSVEAADGQRTADYTFDKSLNGFGYSIISVSSQLLTIKFIQVDGENKNVFDSVMIDLKTSKLK